MFRYFPPNLFLDQFKYSLIKPTMDKNLYYKPFLENQWKPTNKHIKARMTTFTKAKLKKSDDQTNIDKFRVTANITEYQNIKINLL